MRERIINESIASLRREGLRFSIDTLAERLNISKKTVYKYFSNKEELVNLGMPLDYRLIAGAGVFTAVYILSRAVGKIGGSYIGGKLTKAQPVVTKYLGFTLLPHSGVSLVFTGIATSPLSSFAPSLATIVSGTIVAAAIINEIIAVIIAKCAFKRAGEIEEDKPMKL